MVAVMILILLFVSIIILLIIIMILCLKKSNLLGNISLRYMIVRKTILKICVRLMLMFGLIMRLLII